MPIDPYTGSEISPGQRTVQCRRGHINRADSWLAAGSRCSYPGCDHVGDPSPARVEYDVPVSHETPRSERSSGGGWAWIILFALLVVGYVWYTQSRSMLIWPALAPILPAVPADSTPVLDNPGQSAPDNLNVPPNQPAPAVTEDLVPAILATIERYYDTRMRALATLDGAEYYGVLRGDALQRRLDALNTLRNKNCYWDISNRTISFEKVDLVNQNDAVVYATVREDANLYCDGRLDHGSYHEPYRLRIELKRIDEIWYITDQKTLE